MFNTTRCIALITMHFLNVTNQQVWCYHEMLVTAHKWWYNLQCLQIVQLVVQQTHDSAPSLTLQRVWQARQMKEWHVIEYTMPLSTSTPALIVLQVNNYTAMVGNKSAITKTLRISPQSSWHQDHWVWGSTPRQHCDFSSQQKQWVGRQSVCVREWVMEGGRKWGWGGGGGGEGKREGKTRKGKEGWGGGGEYSEDSFILKSHWMKSSIATICSPPKWHWPLPCYLQATGRCLCCHWEQRHSVASSPKSMWPLPVSVVSPAHVYVHYLV